MSDNKITPGRCCDNCENELDGGNKGHVRASMTFCSYRCADCDRTDRRIKEELERIGDIVPDDHEEDVEEDDSPDYPDMDLGKCEFCSDDTYSSNHRMCFSCRATAVMACDPIAKPFTMRAGRCRLRDGREGVASFISNNKWAVSLSDNDITVSNIGKWLPHKETEHDVVAMLDDEPKKTMKERIADLWIDTDDEDSDVEDEDLMCPVCPACGDMADTPWLSGWQSQIGEVFNASCRNCEHGFDVERLSDDNYIIVDPKLPTPDPKPLVIEAGGLYETESGDAWNIIAEKTVFVGQLVSGGLQVEFYQGGYLSGKDDPSALDLVRPHTPAAPVIEMDEGWLFRWATCWAWCDDCKQWEQFEHKPVKKHWGYFLAKGMNMPIPPEHAPTLPPGMRWQDTLTFVGNK